MNLAGLSVGDGRGGKLGHDRPGLPELLQELVERKGGLGQIRPRASAARDAVATDAPFLDEEALSVRRRLGDCLVRPEELEQDKNEEHWSPPASYRRLEVEEII
jgi:hypothetical protein